MTIIDQAFLRLYGRRADAQPVQSEPFTTRFDPLHTSVHLATPTCESEEADNQPTTVSRGRPTTARLAVLRPDKAETYQTEPTNRPGVASQRTTNDLAETLRAIARRQNELRSKSPATVQSHKVPKDTPAELLTMAESDEAEPSTTSLADQDSEVPRRTQAARFHWPRLCDELATSYGHVFGPAVHTLIECGQRGRSLIAVTGCYARQGCTTVLLSLAKILAGRNKSVAIVDGNFGSPSLAERLDIEPATSWQDVLLRGLAVGDALTFSPNEPVALLPLNPKDHREQEVTETKDVFTTARVLRNNFDLTLVDLGPMLVPTHQPIAMKLASSMNIDAGLIVTDNSLALPGDPEIVGRLLRETGCEPLGVIETLVDDWGNDGPAGRQHQG